MTFLKHHALTIAAIPLVSGLFVGVFLMFPVSEHIEVQIVNAEPEEEQSARLVFVGDIMLDRHIRAMIAAHGATHVLGGVRELIEGADFAAGNLEGPITDKASVSGGTKVGDVNNMRFTFPMTTGSLLSSFGFDLVSIANNHMRDFGTSGVESTKNNLEAAGVAYIGDPNGAKRGPVLRNINGIRVAFVAYNEFLGWDPEWTLQDVRDAKRQDADLIVVMAHWGDEYEAEPPARLTDLIARIRDAGADLIIGSHPHIIGARMDMDSMRVYYSLGNFIFDQYWNEEVRCGLAVTVTALKKRGDMSLVYEETKVGMERDGRTVLGCS